MQFQNLQVDWQRLPKAADVELKPIEKNYLKVVYTGWTIFYLAVVIAVTLLFIFNSKMQSAAWIVSVSGGLMILIIATFILSTFSFKRKAYAVREKDILYRTGWIFQSLHIVPFSRIQHCVVESGPIERKFGLASISLYTAASEIKDISIKGLKPEDAEHLKNYILQQIQISR